MLWYPIIPKRIYIDEDAACFLVLLPDGYKTYGIGRAKWQRGLLELAQHPGTRISYGAFMNAVHKDDAYVGDPATSQQAQTLMNTARTWIGERLEEIEYHIDLQELIENSDGGYRLVLNRWTAKDCKPIEDIDEGNADPSSSPVPLPRFHSALRQVLIEREESLAIESWWKKRTNAVLVVSGRPGTGRNTVLDIALNRIARDEAGDIDIFDVPFCSDIQKTISSSALVSRISTAPERYEIVLDSLQAHYSDMQKPALIVIRNASGSDTFLREMASTGTAPFVEAGANIIITTPSMALFDRCAQVSVMAPSREMLAQQLEQMVSLMSSNLKSIDSTRAEQLVELLDGNLAAVCACAEVISDYGNEAEIIEALKTNSHSELGKSLIEGIRQLLELDKLGRKSTETILEFGIVPAQGIDVRLVKAAQYPEDEIANLVRLGILQIREPLMPEQKAFRSVAFADGLVSRITNFDLEERLSNDENLQRILSEKCRVMKGAANTPHLQSQAKLCEENYEALLNSSQLLNNNPRDGQSEI